MRRALSFMLMSVVAVCLWAQVPAGRSEKVTLFDAFVPAAIELNDGTENYQPLANIFLKNSTLIYKKGTTDMQANMAVVKGVSFGKRHFVNVNNQLAEVIDTCGHYTLVCVKLIDIDAFNGEWLNNSDITNISFSENIAVTRLDPNEETLTYPLVNNYYYLVKGKSIPCHERSVRPLVAKKNRNYVDARMRAGIIDWSSVEDLKALMKQFEQ
ncbi:MAG: hypothetical protein Q4F34_01930 [Prevotellaceae bacterium]|nr:hypothetical protein [Prevotellaceae bacterium]